MLADAHIHLVDLLDRDPGYPERVAAGLASFAGEAWTCCAASHDEPEWERSEALRSRLPPFVASFGIHPQWPVWKNADLLARLCAERRIAAIGEAGFDFFGDRPERVRNSVNEATQRAVFEYQLGLARMHGLPLLLHLRKAMDLVYEYSKPLKSVPAVVFHSYSGTLRDTESILKRGINAYFSFGASILNGNKRSIEACAAAPAERLLAETDAPWQPPASDEFVQDRFCKAEDIGAVVAGIARLRGIGREAAEDLTSHNFSLVFEATKSFHLGENIQP
jgi:Mg-dependent DNase